MSDETKSLTPSPTSQEERLERILAEYLRQMERGVVVDQQALLLANPDLADDLREFFANQARMQQLVGADRARSNGNGAALRKLKYFGDYEILEEIAHGGMGVVYKARQTSLNRTVAVKMILAGQLANESDVKRFQAEAEAAANLHHPGIVGIYEVGVQDGQHYYSMEYIDGQNLAQILREKAIPIATAAEYMRDIATVLEFAHGRKVLHRDLKPSNILLDANGRLRITDFGLAKRVEGESDLTMTGQVLGTPSYMSPEQAAAQHAIIGPPTDIYALGAILYELVTGRPPFRSENIGEILRQVQHDEPVRPRLLNPKLPRDLETICLKCLEKEPRRRYGSALELADELSRYLRGEPIRARRIGPLSRGVRWCLRNPAVSGLCTAVAALMLVVGVALPAGIALVKRAGDEEQKRLKLEDDLLVNQADELSSGREPDFAKAELKLTTAIERRPNDAGLYVKRARVRFEMEHNVDALADGQRARELGLESGELELLMLLAARELGQRGLASSAWDLQEKAPESIESILAQVFTTIPNAQSLEKLDKAFLSRPFDSRLLSLRGQANLHILQYQGDKKVYDQAVSDLVRALQSRPFDLRARQALCLCHLQYYFLADLNQRPLANAKELLDAWPAAEADWRRDALFALWRLKGEEFAMAAEICQAGEERFPDRPEFAHLLGQALYRKKEYVAADDAFARCEALFAKQPVTLWPLSRLQLTAQRALCGAGLKAHDEWRSKLVKALEEPEFDRWTPDEWTYHDWHAVVHAHVPLKPKETGGWCTRWRKAAPGCPTPYCVIVEGHDTGISFPLALKLAPSHRSARLGQARQHSAARRFAEAIADCEIYLQFKPDSPPALLVLARVLSEAGATRDLKRARALIERVLALEPRHAQAWEVLARVESYSGNHAAALAALDKACQLEPESDAFQLRKGWTLMEMGAAEAALEHAEAVLRSSPPTYARLHGFAEILCIPPAADVRCGQRAVELLGQALALSQKQVTQRGEPSYHSKYSNRLPAALYRAQRWSEGLAVKSTQPDNLRDLFQAMILFRLGRQGEARAVYDRAAEQAGADLVAFNPHQHQRAVVRREAALLLGYHFDQEAKAQDVARHDVRPGDCPQLGGWGARNNVSECSRIPATWHPGKFDRKTGDWIRDKSENIKWQVPLGSLTYGNPVVANGNVLVGTSNTSGYLKRYPSDVDLGCVLCFREADGEFRWQFSSEKLPTGRVHDWPQLGICSAPLIEGERAWFVSNRGVVVCVDTAGFWDGEDDGQPIGPLKESPLFHVPAYCRDVLGERPVHPVLRERLEALGIKIKDDELGGFRAVQLSDEKAAASLPAGQKPPLVLRLTWQKKTDAGARDWLRFQLEGDQLLVEEVGAAPDATPVKVGSIPIQSGPATGLRKSSRRYGNSSPLPA